MPTPVASVFELSATEKLQLVEDLWDDLASSQEAIPVHAWQVRELDRRKCALEADSATAFDWESAKRHIRNRNDR